MFWRFQRQCPLLKHIPKWLTLFRRHRQLWVIQPPAHIPAETRIFKDSGNISIVVEGQAAAGFDANWLRNAVQEPLDEANIDGLQME